MQGPVSIRFCWDDSLIVSQQPLSITFVVSSCAHSHLTTLSVKHWPNIVAAVREPCTAHFTRGRKALVRTPPLPPNKYISQTLYKCWAEGI
jgi:hypothetical protein